MSNLVVWDGIGSVVNLLTTELNSIATAKVCAVSSAWDNTSGKVLYVTFDLKLNTISPTAGASCTIWGWASDDGTNYGGPQPSSGSAASGSDPALKVTVAVDTTASGTPRMIVGPFMVLPVKYKFQVENNTGATLNASSNTLDMYPLKINLNG